MKYCAITAIQHFPQFLALPFYEMFLIADLVLPSTLHPLSQDVVKAIPIP